MTPRPEWTTPADVTAQVRRLWDRGDLLEARVLGTSLFPLQLRCARPAVRAVSERFQDVRDWIRELESNGRETRGFGYDIQWVEHTFQAIGRNRVPEGLVVPTEADALRLIGESRAAGRFQQIADETLAAFPSLRPWFAKKPHTVLEHAAEWERILAVLLWFRDHPRSGLYLRQVDIPGIDTKFVEERTGVLSELLDAILPPDAVTQEASPTRAFEQRYGLQPKPLLVRFRVLDERLRISGLSDLAVPVAQFARLELPVRRVFMTENDINGLAFPEIREAVVIFGLGYDVTRLEAINWLRFQTIHYWGDIDTHGFAILDRLRGVHPDVRSFLMDEDTLLAHRPMVVREETPFHGTLARLTEAEHRVFEGLVRNRWGENVRLEQERVSYGWWTRAVAATVDRTEPRT